MPIHYATYTCNHCHETFDASSENGMTACPCEKTHVRPNEYTTTSLRGSDFTQSSRETRYSTDDFVLLTERARELVDILESLHVQQQTDRDYSQPNLYTNHSYKTLPDGTVIMTNFRSRFYVANGKHYTGESNEANLELDLNRYDWHPMMTPEQVEARLKRYVDLFQKACDKTIDLQDRGALRNYVEENHLLDDTKPTGATNYTIIL